MNFVKTKEPNGRDLAIKDILAIRSRIISPTHEGTDHSKLEPMMGILLKRTS